MAFNPPPPPPQGGPSRTPPRVQLPSVAATAAELAAIQLMLPSAPDVNRLQDALRTIRAPHQYSAVFFARLFNARDSAGIAGALNYGLRAAVNTAAAAQRQHYEKLRAEIAAAKHEASGSELAQKAVQARVVELTQALTEQADDNARLRQQRDTLVRVANSALRKPGRRRSANSDDDAVRAIAELGKSITELASDKERLRRERDALREAVNAALPPRQRRQERGVAEAAAAIQALAAAADSAATEVERLRAELSAQQARPEAPRQGAVDPGANGDPNNPVTSLQRRVAELAHSLAHENGVDGVSMAVDHVNPTPPPGGNATWFALDSFLANLQGNADMVTTWEYVRTNADSPWFASLQFLLASGQGRAQFEKWAAVLGQAAQLPVGSTPTDQATRGQWADQLVATLVDTLTSTADNNIVARRLGQLDPSYEALPAGDVASRLFWVLQRAEPTNPAWAMLATSAGRADIATLDRLSASLGGQSSAMASWPGQPAEPQTMLQRAERARDRLETIEALFEQTISAATSSQWPLVRQAIVAIISAGRTVSTDGRDTLLANLGSGGGGGSGGGSGQANPPNMTTVQQTALNDFAARIAVAVVSVRTATDPAMTLPVLVTTLTTAFSQTHPAEWRNVLQTGSPSSTEAARLLLAYRHTASGVDGVAHHWDPAISEPWLVYSAMDSANDTRGRAVVETCYWAAFWRRNIPAVFEGRRASYLQNGVKELTRKIIAANLTAGAVGDVAQGNIINTRWPEAAFHSFELCRLLVTDVAGGNLGAIEGNQRAWADTLHRSVTGRGGNATLAQHWATNYILQPVTVIAVVMNAMGASLVQMAPIDLFSNVQLGAILHRMATDPPDQLGANSERGRQVRAAAMTTLMAQQLYSMPNNVFLGSLVQPGYTIRGGIPWLQGDALETFLSQLVSAADDVTGTPQAALRQVGVLLATASEERNRRNPQAAADAAVLAGISRTMAAYLDYGERVFRLADPERTNISRDVPSLNHVNNVMVLVESIVLTLRAPVLAGVVNGGRNGTLTSIAGFLTSVATHVPIDIEGVVHGWLTLFTAGLLSASAFLNAAAAHCSDDGVFLGGLEEAGDVLAPFLEWRHRARHNLPAGTGPVDLALTLGNLFQPTAGQYPTSVQRCMSNLGARMSALGSSGGSSTDAFVMLNALVASDELRWPAQGAEAALVFCLRAGLRLQHQLRTDPWFRGPGASGRGAEALTENEVELAASGLDRWTNQAESEAEALAVAYAIERPTAALFDGVAWANAWADVMTALAGRNAVWPPQRQVVGSFARASNAFLLTQAYALGTGQAEFWAVMANPAQLQTFTDTWRGSAEALHDFHEASYALTDANFHRTAQAPNPGDEWRRWEQLLTDALTTTYTWHRDSFNLGGRQRNMEDTRAVAQLGHVFAAYRALSRASPELRPGTDVVSYTVLQEHLTTAMANVAPDRAGRLQTAELMARGTVLALRGAFGWAGGAQGNAWADTAALDLYEARTLPMLQGLMRWSHVTVPAAVAPGNRSQQLGDALTVGGNQVQPALALVGHAVQRDALVRLLGEGTVAPGGGPRWVTLRLLWQAVNDVVAPARTAAEVIAALAGVMASGMPQPPWLVRLNQYLVGMTTHEGDHYRLLATLLPDDFLNATARTLRIVPAGLRDILTTLQAYVPMRPGGPDGLLLGSPDAILNTRSDLTQRLSAVPTSRAVLQGGLQDTQLLLTEMLARWATHDPVTNTHPQTTATAGGVALAPLAGAAVRAESIVGIMKGLRSTPGSVLTAAMLIGYLTNTRTLQVPLLDPGNLVLQMATEIGVALDAVEMVRLDGQGRVRARVDARRQAVAASPGLNIARYGNRWAPIGTIGGRDRNRVWWTAQQTDPNLRARLHGPDTYSTPRSRQQQLDAVKDRIQTVVSNADDRAVDMGGGWLDPPIERYPTAQRLMAVYDTQPMVSILVWLAARTVPWLADQLPTWAVLEAKIDALPAPGPPAAQQLALASHLLGLEPTHAAIPGHLRDVCARYRPMFKFKVLGVPLSVPHVLAVSLRGIQGYEVLNPIPDLPELQRGLGAQYNARALWITWLDEWARTTADFAIGDPDRALYRRTETQAYAMSIDVLTTWRAAAPALVPRPLMTPVVSRQRLIDLRCDTVNLALALLDVRLNSEGALWRLTEDPGTTTVRANPRAGQGAALATFRLGQRAMLALLPLVMGNAPVGLAAMVGDDWDPIDITPQQAVLLEAVLQLYRRWLLLVQAQDDPVPIPLVVPPPTRLMQTLRARLPDVNEAPATHVDNGLLGWPSLAASDRQAVLLRRMRAAGLLRPGDTPQMYPAATASVLSDYENAVLACVCAQGKPDLWAHLAKHPEKSQGPLILHRAVATALVMQDGWGPGYKPLTIPQTAAQTANVPWVALMLASEATAAATAAVPLPVSDLRWVVVDSDSQTLVLNAPTVHAKAIRAAPELKHLARVLAIYDEASAVDIERTVARHGPRAGSLSDAEGLWAWLRLLDPSWSLALSMLEIDWTAAPNTTTAVLRRRLRLGPAIATLVAVQPNIPQPWLTPGIVPPVLVPVIDADLLTCCGLMLASSAQPQLTTVSAWWQAVLPGLGLAYWLRTNDPDAIVPLVPEWPEDHQPLLIAALLLAMVLGADHPVVSQHRGELAAQTVTESTLARIGQALRTSPPERRAQALALLQLALPAVAQPPLTQ